MPMSFVRGSTRTRSAASCSHISSSSTGGTDARGPADRSENARRRRNRIALTSDSGRKPCPIHVPLSTSFKGWEMRSRTVLPIWLAALLVAILWGVIAAVLASQGRSQLKKVDTSLPATTQTIKEDVQWAKHPTSSS